MPITTITSREFNQDVGTAKRAALNGPVFITDRKRVAHVLLTIEEYQALTKQSAPITELLGMPESAEIIFDPAPLGELYRPVDFS